MPADAWRLRKAKTVVKLLALAPNHALHREQVMEVLWPELTPAAARNNLNQALHAARRALDACGPDGSGRLVLRGEMVHLSPDDELWVDVVAFERAAARARRTGTSVAFREALSLYAGDLLPEDRYESWTVNRRAALREQALCLLGDLATLHRVHGDDAGEIGVLHEALALDPLHEPAHRDLMRAFLRVGRRQEAVAQFQRLREALTEALATVPEPETHALYTNILLSAGNGHPGGRIPRPTAAPHVASGNLRPALTSFVGRERELAEVAALLERGRLVTLTGAGGSGKTRLASEAAAARIERVPGGAWIVKLEAVAAGEFVAQAVARTLSVQLAPDAGALVALARELTDRGPLLLLLDNCEHVVDDCAGLALELLQACPSLGILATSREPLRIPGELVFAVPPLSVPPQEATASAGDVGGCEAVQLFVDRAASRVPGFSLAEHAAAVAEICRALDGIPLAIELAAAAIGALSPRQLADRLTAALELPTTSRRDRVARHQTMRSALDWSHGLLAPRERVLFRRLGVFAGSFPLEAAAPVCARDPIEAADVLPALVGLVEKSLVQSEESAGGRRFRLLEPVRRYALEKLGDAGERRELQRRHRDWCAALVSELSPRLAAGQRRALDRLEAEHDNVRAGLTSALVDDPGTALRIASEIWPLWLERGYFDEGARWLHAVLSEGAGPGAARAEALLGACALDTRRGAFERRRELADERLAILRRLGDPRRTAEATNEVGLTAWSQSDHARAQDAYAAAMELAQQIGDARVAACVVHSRALLEGSRGALAVAATLFAEARALLLAIGAEERRFFPAALHCLMLADEPWCPGLRLYFEESMMLFRRLPLPGADVYVAVNHAHLARADGSLDEALELSERALQLADGRGDPAERAVTLVERGNVARARGEHRSGRALLEEACEIRRALSDRRGVAMAVGDLGLLEAAAGNAGPARALLGEARALFAEMHDVVGVAGAALNLANVALAEGNRDEARTLLYESLEPVALRGLARMSSWMRATLAEIELAVGNTTQGQHLSEQARAEFDRLGDRRGLDWYGRLELPKQVQSSG